MLAKTAQGGEEAFSRLRGYGFAFSVFLLDRIPGLFVRDEMFYWVFEAV